MIEHILVLAVALDNSALLNTVEIADDGGNGLELNKRIGSVRMLRMTLWNRNRMCIGIPCSSP